MVDYWAEISLNKFCFEVFTRVFNNSLKHDLEVKLPREFLEFLLSSYISWIFFILELKTRCVNHKAVLILILIFSKIETGTIGAISRNSANPADTIHYTNITGLKIAIPIKTISKLARVYFEGKLDYISEGVRIQSSN